MSESSFLLSPSGSERDDDRQQRNSRSSFVGRKRSRSLSKAPSHQRRRVGRVKKAYIELLNQCIQETRGEYEDPEPLSSSQIGASFWTSAEKSAFFNALQRVGPDNIPALSAAVHSKSLLEIHEYLRLLRAGVIDAKSILSKEGSAVAEVPAAVEVSTECENALEETAQSLSLKIDQSEQQPLQDQYGESWLISKIFAERLEEEYNQKVEAHSGDEDQVGTESLFPAAELLSLCNILRLSEAIFMNGPPGTGNNWVDHDHELGPALYRHALDDFYTLAVSLTKRLVQATLFQAMSRIRAMDADKTHNYTPQPLVSTIDVNAANEMMGMRFDRMSYWAKLARKFNLGVYSDSKKFNDERPRTKQGYALTYDEVEKELQLLPAAVEESERSNSDIDRYDSSDDADEGELEEDEYLETMDLQLSREEERRLWDLVAPAKRRLAALEATTPIRPRFAKQERMNPWRQRFSYEPEWSHFDSQLHATAFESMQVRGRTRRLVRKSLRGPPDRKKPAKTYTSSENSGDDDVDEKQTSSREDDEVES